MAVLWTIPERCRRCYTCVRECPAKAIRVENGQAQVIPERCIACGNCVKVCAQGAKQVQDDVPRVRAMLASGRPVIACIAPAFPAAFDRVEPGRVIQAVRKLGFAEVWEVAFGAELLVPEYVRLFHQARRTGQPRLRLGGVAWAGCGSHQTNVRAGSRRREKGKRVKPQRVRRLDPTGLRRPGGT